MQLEIFEVSLVMVAEVSLLADRVQRKDRDLARQMRRSSISVSLNTEEATCALGGNRNTRLHTAMGSARETRAAIRVAIAARYIAVDGTAEVLDRLDRIIATIWKLLHR